MRWAQEAGRWAKDSLCVWHLDNLKGWLSGRGKGDGQEVMVQEKIHDGKCWRWDITKVSSVVYDLSAWVKGRWTSLASRESRSWAFKPLNNAGVTLMMRGRTGDSWAGTRSSRISMNVGERPAGQEVWRQCDQKTQAAGKALMREKNRRKNAHLPSWFWGIWVDRWEKEPTPLKRKTIFSTAFIIWLVILCF